MKLRMLSFQDDDILARRIKEESNYCDPAHLYAATFGISRVVLSELSPIDLDGCERLTICANVEQEICGAPGYNHVPGLGISFYNLDRDTSRVLYQFKRFDEAFQNDTASLLLDILAEIDRMHGGKNRLKERREGILAHLRDCCFQKETFLEKFSKVSRNKKYKAMVYSCMGHGIGDAVKAELADRSTGKVIVSKWMAELPCNIYSSEGLCRTYWEGNRFYVIFWRSEPQRTEVVEIPS